MLHVHCEGNPFLLSFLFNYPWSDLLRETRASPSYSLSTFYDPHLFFGIYNLTSQVGISKYLNMTSGTRMAWETAFFPFLNNFQSRVFIC